MGDILVVSMAWVVSAALFWLLFRAHEQISRDRWGAD